MVRFYCLCALVALSQISSAQNVNELLLRLKRSGIDSLRINAQIDLADYYIYKPGSEKKDYDSAGYYIESAQRLTVKLNLEAYRYRAMRTAAFLAHERGHLKQADQLFSRVAGFYHKTDYLKEASVWRFYADQIAWDADHHRYIRRNSYRKAMQIYRSNHNSLEAAKMLEEVVEIEMEDHHFSLAESLAKELLSDYRSAGYHKFYKAYDLLAEIAYRKNEMQKALLARIQLVNYYEADSKKDNTEGVDYYFALAGACFNEKKYVQAIENYKKCAECSKLTNSSYHYFLSVHGLIRSYAASRQYNAALSHLQQAEKFFKKKTIEQECILLSCELQLYLWMNRIDAATRLLPHFKRKFRKYYQQAKQDIDYYAIDNYLVFYDPLPNYYQTTKNWKVLDGEVKIMMGLTSEKTSVLTLLKFARYQYKIDSARGNMASAFRRFQRITTIKDSLNNLQNRRQINELEANYRSIKKDKMIEHLNYQATIQKTKIANISTQKNLTLAGIFLSIVFALFMCIAYRIKNLNNLVLRGKQSEINAKNETLSFLVEEKEKLIEDKDLLLGQQSALVEEKEWLIKEVHHRVKNNLQIVMSLLYTQSAYLQNADAVNAIRDIQNRVQAISIIHQKLYQKTGASSIVLSDYINEMICYLSSSYDCTSRHISISQALSPVILDISQAVPLGLLLNEAVTNAIKYAFGPDGGLVEVEAGMIDAGITTLRIKDNGIGLPSDFEPGDMASLGMDMMRALAKQLGGALELINHSGVEIIVKFKAVLPERVGLLEIK